MRSLCLVFVLVGALSCLSLAGVALEMRQASAPYPTRTAGGERVVLFLGDSLSAGYGLLPSQSFPALIQRKIEDRGWNFRVVNAGLSGDTTASGLRRVDWLLKQPVQVLVLELGANDGLRGVPLRATEENLQGIVDKVKKMNPDLKIVIAGMRVPPNLGPEYTERFRSIFPSLAKRNQAALIPFLLEGVAGVPELNLPDGIHPTDEGHRMVADTIWKVLRPLLATYPE